MNMIDITRQLLLYSHILAFELAMTAVGQAQNRLVAARDSVLSSCAPEFGARPSERTTAYAQDKGGQTVLPSPNALATGTAMAG